MYHPTNLRYPTRKVVKHAGTQSVKKSDPREGRGKAGSKELHFVTESDPKEAKATGSSVKREGRGKRSRIIGKRGSKELDFVTESDPKEGRGKSHRLVWKQWKGVERRWNF
ncbi:hypothetical protein DFH06DRAFT_1144146 [Mycena polygramma]|nr:hypothetical protein DFH06DRAFT_1144146 [Mycena polygramma]